MDHYKAKPKKGPEAIIQEAIIKNLRYKGWHVMVTHGNMFQSGFPDLFASHSAYGQRWIEVKKPDFKGSKFTNAQLEQFPKMCANGSGVWILTTNDDEDYALLFGPPNWANYFNMM